LTIPIFNLGGIMKYKKTKQRFKLNKRTVATLSNEAQRLARGGAPETQTCGCATISCEPCATFDDFCYTLFADCKPVTYEDSFCQCVFTDPCQTELTICVSAMATCNC